ncbi:uncharacterized protein LOC111706793 [Eurytemora carolleeae]|uniref:uncharacterized protein LOC111706793 n=1 Tax=Eurytemora carolleeae TaxID=1294199 RepID=UPI000C7596AC|nr:uncharacterized protein LOC111706793 [Eurytemora carolleeae]|eukprot:XP_023335500.1 uncharacterized protein LOC111706793 [Eurytemora affinis]
MAHVLIRPYKYEDEREVQKLVQNSCLEQVNPVYLGAFFRESTIQVLLVFCALSFIFCGVPLYLCWVIFPVAAVLLYPVVYLGFWHWLATQAKDLDNIDENYGSNPKACFWIAELISEEMANNCRTSEKVLFLKNVKAFSKPEIIAVCAVYVKTDKNMQEPPNTVGVVGRFAVKKDFQRFGLAGEMFAVLWNHSLYLFRALEVDISEHQVIARNFFEKRDFTFLHQTDCSAVPLLFNYRIQRMRRACILNSMEDDLKETIIQK